MTPPTGLPPASAVVEDALSAAGTAGCIVVVEDHSEADVRFATNTVTTNGVRRSRRVTVIGLADRDGGTSAGVASRSGEVDVASLVRAALTDAKASPPADDAAALLGGGADPNFGDEPGLTDLDVLGGVLASLGGAFARAERADTVLAGFAQHAVVTTSLGVSTGLRRRHVQPTGTLELVGRAGGGKRSAWVGRSTVDFRDVAIDELEAALNQRLAWASERVELDAGRYEVVLPPGAVGDLMAYLYNAASGADAEDGRSVFSAPDGATKVGQRLAPLPFELRSDPAEPSLECAPFLAVEASSASSSVFDNGLGLGRTTWIRDGSLERLFYSRARAGRAGTTAAAPIDNLVLELPGAQGTTADLVAATERGLLLECLWYIREVDPTTLLLTGLTRDGVYLVEDGQVRAAVNNFRFNESPVDLLARATQASATSKTLGREFNEWLPRIAMPALRVPDFNMSSVSPAS
jgi:predicted Zn-dependent protease